MKAKEELNFIKQVSDQILIELDDLVVGRKINVPGNRSVAQTIGRIEGMAVALGFFGDSSNGDDDEA